MFRSKLWSTACLENSSALEEIFVRISSINAMDSTPEPLRVEAQRPFADVSCAGVCIDNLIELLSVRLRIRRCFDNFSFAEAQADVVERCAAIKRFAIELDGSVDAFFYGTSEALPVGDIPLAKASDRADAFDAEGQICAWAGDVHVVGLSHQIFQRLHCLAHLCIIHADAYTK